MSETESPRTPSAAGSRVDPWRLFALLPGVIAVGLAGLYGVGAILWVGSILDADLAVGDVMTLIPLDQVLARGVGTVALIAGVSLIVAPLAWGLSRAAASDERQGRSRSPLDPRKGTHRLVLVVTTTTLIALLFLVAPPVVWLGITAGSVWVVVLWWQRGPKLDVPLRTAIAYTAAVGLAIAVAHTLFDPDPLPPVHVVIEGRAKPVDGRLLTTTGDTWYVVVGDESRVAAIPADKVIRTRIDAEADPRPSAFGDLFGWEVLPGARE